MNKKIGLAIVTYKDNYGSALQSYTTQEIVRQLGYQTEIFDINGVSGKIMRNKVIFYLRRLFEQDEFSYVFEKAKSKFKKDNANQYAKNMRIRHEVYKKFYNDYFEFGSKVSSWDELTSESEKYSSVLVGSDQLWRPSNIAGRYFTLEFVPDNVNKIAYSTSFGVSVLPKYQHKQASEFLSRIEYLSVRENTGQKLVKDLTGRDIPVVCDPTMLFDAEQWMSIQSEEPIIKEDYILTYFMGHNPQHREFAKELKKKTGYKIIGLLHGSVYIAEDENYVDLAPYDIGPAEFINLIRNAKFMCTDSFHGTVFSILNSTSFFAFRRYEETSGFSTNDRMHTLLEWTGFTNRMLNGNEQIDDGLLEIPNFEYALQEVEKKRKMSLEYLKNALAKGDIYGQASK